MPKKSRLDQGLQGGNLKCIDFDFADRQQFSDGAGPRSALKLLGADLGSVEETTLWIERATMEAILGGMRLSLKSLKSGLSCYTAFVGTYMLASTRTLVSLCQIVAGRCFPKHGLPFPPSLPVLLAWSTLFRSHRTLTNYLGYVKTGCMLVGVSTEVSLKCKP